MTAPRRFRHASSAASNAAWRGSRGVARAPPRTSDGLGQSQHVASPRLRFTPQPASDLADRSPRANFFTPPQKSRPNSPDRRFGRHDRGKTQKLPARQVLEEIKQLAVPGDDPHLGRNRPILQGMSVNDAHTGVIFGPPAQPPGRLTEGHFLVIKEEILVHAPQAGHHRRIHEHASAGNPIDLARANSPTGLVFPPRARYELLPDGPGQGGIDPDRALRRSVGVPQAKADDSRWAMGIGFVRIESRQDLAQKTTSDFHIWIENKEPGTSETRQPALTPAANPSLWGRATSRKPGRGSGTARGPVRARHCRRPRSDTGPIESMARPRANWSGGAHRASSRS